MMPVRRTWLDLPLIGSLMLVTVVTASPAPGAGPDRTIADFTLPDAAGKPRSLSEFKDAKAVVVVFMGTACPINNAYAPRLAELHAKFASQGVAMLGINANANDTTEDIAAHIKEFNLPFPVLCDPRQVVADRFGATKNPEAFVLDAQRVIRYQGRIDDQFGIGFQRPRPTQNDLRDAVEAVVAGKPVAVAVTEVAGCLLSRAKQARSDATITYSGHVAAIVQKHCQECHRPGQIGPMPLTTYDEVAGWAENIRWVVDSGRMPPWHAAPHVGTFANDRRLSRAEKQTLLDWIEQGCAEGDRTKTPPNPTYPEGWRIGKPDLILTMEKPYEVPAQAPRGGVPYLYSIVMRDFPEDRWVQAAEARPGNRAVVHHIICYVRPPGPRARMRPDGIGDGFLVAYAPGDLPVAYPPGFAKKIPKGSTLFFQMHYTPNGTAQADQSSVGLIFAKEPPRHEVRTRSVAQPRFLIPAGAENHRVDAANTFTRDAVLLSMNPHMHLRGKAFEYRAVFPDGRKETLLSVPKYDFNWQTNYIPAAPIRLPAGTRLECTAHFDNSSKNPNNPDPTQPVRWGDQTWEEMMIGFIDYYYADDDKAKGTAGSE